LVNRNRKQNKHMKKLLITFLICGMFGYAPAQNYSQRFNEVFQHVDLSQASTGIIYERVLPFSNLLNHSTNLTISRDTSSYEQFIMAYDTGSGRVRRP